MSHNVPVQSLIDHIKTAIDVDPWAKEMMENLLKEQEAVVRCKYCKYGSDPVEGYIACNNDIGTFDCIIHEPNWFCANGERRVNDD